MGVFCDFQVCMTEKDEQRTSVCELEFKLRAEFMGEFFFFFCQYMRMHEEPNSNKLLTAHRRACKDIGY